jgi:hypothetical protein
MSQNESQSIAGARACFEIVQRLEEMLAGDGTQTTDEYFAKHDAAMAAILAAAGPMSPKAEGALRVLAEIIVGETETASTFCLDKWRPEAVMVPEERDAERSGLFEACAADSMRAEVSNVVPFRRA